jgi:hypothetical protein
MLSFYLHCWSALHITWTPTFGEFMHIIPHNLLSDEHVWAHPWCLTPPHRRRTDGSRGATQRGVRLNLGGVSQLTLWRQGWTLVRFIFIFYFVRLPQCNKYSDVIVTFISIYSVIICVAFFGPYMRWTRLRPLNSGVTLDHFSLPNNVPVNHCDMLRLIWSGLIGFPSIVYPTPCKQKNYWIDLLLLYLVLRNSCYIMIMFQVCCCFNNCSW